MMPGQISLEALIQDKTQELEKKYPRPIVRQRDRIDEGWFDDWHYTEIEEPSQADVYYAVELFNDTYMFTYKAWVNGWYKWDTWTKKWKQDPECPIMWVRIPSKYRQTDKSLRERDDEFVKWRMEG